MRATPRPSTATTSTATPHHRDRRRRLLAGSALALAAIGGVGWWASTRQPEPSPEAFCQQLAASADLDEVLLGDAEDIGRGAAALRRAVAVAPPEVAPDALVLADAVDRLAEGARAQPKDPQAGMDAALAAMQPELAGITAASQAVGIWASGTCGLELDGTDPPPADPAPPPDAPVAAPEGAATPS